MRKLFLLFLIASSLPLFSQDNFLTGRWFYIEDEKDTMLLVFDGEGYVSMGAIAGGKTILLGGKGMDIGDGTKLDLKFATDTGTFPHHIDLVTYNSPDRKIIEFLPCIYQVLGPDSIMIYIPENFDGIENPDDDQILKLKSQRPKNFDPNQSVVFKRLK
jgi:hypothetical protein